MFMDSIKFYWKFNWIYRGFDCKKIDFEVNLSFNWKKLKFRGQIIIFKIWFGQIRGLMT
jgi:hypothetical protein